MPQFEYWTPKEIADEVGVTPGYIVDLIGGQSPYIKLSAIKVGKQWLIADAEAKSFIEKYRSSNKDFYSSVDIAKAIGKSRAYVINALTGYGGRKEPTLKSEKRGDRWIISKEEAERFIAAHRKT